MINIDLNAKHSLAAANAHYYKQPTDERYIDRVLKYHDLIYLVDGGWAFTEGDVEYPLETGDVLMLAAGRHHFNRLPCLPETRTFCLHVSCEPGDREDNPASTGLPTLIHIKHSEKIKHYFDEIVSTYWSESPYKEQKTSALVDLLLFELYEEQQKQEAKKTDVAIKAMEIITSTPHRRYQAKEVADMLFVSTKTLNNAMNKRIGMPFYTYQKNQKLDMVALQLEMEPDLRLQEIATAFGFHDEFHMSKAFKQKFGISPQKFRNEKIQNK